MLPRYRLLIFLAAWMQAASAGTLVLRDAAVYTVNDKQPWASAVVIRDGRIAYVGDDAGLKPYLGVGAHVMDLHGAMVLPGFHDAHLHPMSGAMRLIQCSLAAAKSLPELYAAVRKEAAARPAWVFCNGVPESLGSGITREKLDEAVPDRPVFIRTENGFTGWANSKALAAAGLDLRGTGRLTGDATDLVRSKVPAPSQAQYREALRRASAMANSFGITSMFDAAAAPDLLAAYRAADLAGELTVRMVAAQRVDPGQGLGQVNALIVRRQHAQGRRFRADAAKIFMDEEIPYHTAAMLAPYADAPDSRGPVYGQEQVQALDALVARLDAAGFLIHFHAMGDAAVRAALDALEQAARANGPMDRRHQIAHDGMIDPADIPRFGRLGIAANFSPSWFAADDPASADTVTALGPQRSKWMFPIGAVAAAGGLITIGSDWPQRTLNPLDEIQYAVTRQPLDGSRPPLQPEQRITLAQAIAAYTRDAAWAVREDGTDGTIEVGKSADLVVLDKDLFKTDVHAIHDAHVLLTLLDGAPVYHDPQLTWPRM